jgi:hypothetical protein
MRGNVAEDQSVVILSGLVANDPRNLLTTD